MLANSLSWREFFLRNKRLKALSVFLAVLTWYIIQDTISFEIEIPDVRLKIEVKDGMAILNQSAATVDVTLRGSQEDIQMLDPRRLQAVVELNQDSSPAPMDIHVTPAMIRGVRGARVVAVHPSRIAVTLDRQAEKLVPVKGRTLGEPLFGEVVTVTCEPSTVLLRGPAAKLRTTDSVYTQPVEVDGRVESFVRRCAVQSPGDNWVAQMEPSDVQVKVVITRKNVGRQWKNVPVNAVIEPGEPLDLAVEPTAVDVVLTGRLNEDVAADKLQIRAYADCIGVNTPGVYTVPVRVYVSGGGAVAVASPDTVKVTVRLPAK